MAQFIKWLKTKDDTWYFQLMAAVLYALMLIAVLICFTGNGQFIYEL